MCLRATHISFYFNSLVLCVCFYWITGLFIRISRTLYILRKPALCTISCKYFFQVFHFCFDFNMTYFPKHNFILLISFQAVLNTDLVFLHYLVPQSHNCFTQTLLNYFQGLDVLCLSHLWDPVHAVSLWSILSVFFSWLISTSHSKLTWRLLLQ